MKQTDTVPHSADLRAVLEALGDAILVLDLEGVVLFANPRAIDFFPRHGADLEGQILDLPRTLGRVTEVEIPKLDGGVRNTELHLSLLSWEGEPAHVVTLCDITDRLRAQQLERQLLQNERLTAIGRIAAGVAHQVNNPAAYITCDLEMMRTLVKELADDTTPRARRRRPELTREVNEMIGECLEGIRRIASIVTDLRMFSRVCEDKVELIDLRDVVAAACKMLAAPLRTQAELVVDLGELSLIPGHRDKLVQVVTNLLSNALDAVSSLPTGERKIIVRARESLGTITVSVEDSGPGIPPELKDKLFEPFVTGKAAEATGLGLALCAEIVRGHGGEIRVHSREGCGSRFEFSIPLETGLKAADGESVVPLSPVPANARRLRVLVVDDEPALVRCYKRMLDEHCEVVIALDGNEAHSRVLRGPEFDVVLCDLAMHGPTLYEALSASAPRFCERIIFATGGAFTRSSQDFLDRVKNPVLKKPFQRSDLVEVIDRVGRRVRNSVSRKPHIQVVTDAPA